MRERIDGLFRKITRTPGQDPTGRTDWRGIEDRFTEDTQSHKQMREALGSVRRRRFGVLGLLGERIREAIRHRGERRRQE